MASKRVREIQAELDELANAEIAAHSQRFFRTGSGEYGEGDRFLGIRVPVLRKAAKRHREVSLSDVVTLLKSAWHEQRLLALLLLVLKFERGAGDQQKEIFQLYSDHLQYVNNWDLVDSSAHQIIGGYLHGRSQRLLDRLAKSKVLWERRVAIIATYHFIKRDEFDATLRIAERLLQDDEDLIHKAVGWMLREVGNRERKVEEAFLRTHYADMPRTMLRYSIEKFPEPLRKRYLEGRI
jgi:3-methyladenine DNA glycosylase AlkD